MSLELESRRLSRGASLLGVEEFNKIEVEELKLPTYTLFYIFNFLHSRKEISKCKLVSKLWKTIASDACFGWIQAITMPFFEVPDGSTSYYTQSHYLHYNFLEPVTSGKPIEYHSTAESNFDAIYFRGNTVLMRRIQFLDKAGKPILTGMCYPPPNITCTVPQRYQQASGHGFGPFLADMLDVCTKYQKLWRCELLNIGNKGLPSYVFVLEVNIMELEKTVESGGTVPLAEVLSFNAYQENYSSVQKAREKINQKDAHIPMKSVATQKQPLGFSKSIKLYKYQLDAVNWMKSVEEDVGVGFDSTGVIPWKAAKTGIVFKEPYSGDMLSVKNLKEAIVHVNPRGGILADDMGLGKTTEIIGLILANPGDPSTIDPVKYEATLTNKDFSNPISLENESDLFVTNATLVICPDHLIKQWHEEIEKNTRPHLNVISLADFKSVKSCPYSDIINADVVLVAFAVLSHRSYLDIGNYRCSSFPRRHRIAKYLERLWKSGSEMLDVKGPVMEHFLWRRIVFDEAHEYGRVSYRLEKITAKYYWCVSGTPFPTGKYFQEYLKILQFPATSSYFQEWAYIDIVMNNLYWRNTKESVKNEYEVPPIVEDLVLLDYTPIEKLSYQACNRNQIKQLLTSHIGLGFGFSMRNNSLTELRSSVIAHIENRLNKLQRSKKDWEEDIQKQEQEIGNNDAGIRIMEKNLEALIAAGEPYDHLPYQIRFFRATKTTSKQIEEDTVLKDKLTSLDKSYYDGPDMSSEVVFQEVSASDLEAQKQTEEKPSNGDGNEAKIEGEKKEEKSGEEELPFSMLKGELAKRGIETNNKQRKADLQKALKEAVKNMEEPKKRKNESTNKKAAKKQKVDPKEEPEQKSNKPKDKDAIRTTDDKVKEQNVLKWLVEKQGTKLGNLLHYLKQLWDDNPAAKVIVFSMFTDLLDKISDVLAEYNVNHTSMEGNLQKQTQQIRTFKKDSVVRVLLLNLNKVSAGTNIIEATHIIFMEPASGSPTQANATESQAVARAYRQGQTTNVTVTRFIVRDTVDYTAHIANHGTANTEQVTTEGQASHSGLSKMQRTSSLITAIATTPSLQNTSEMVRLLEA